MSLSLYPMSLRPLWLQSFTVAMTSLFPLCGAGGRHSGRTWRGLGWNKCYFAPLQRVCNQGEYGTSLWGLAKLAEKWLHLIQTLPTVGLKSSLVDLEHCTGNKMLRNKKHTLSFFTFFPVLCKQNITTYILKTKPTKRN